MTTTSLGLSVSAALRPWVSNISVVALRGDDDQRPLTHVPDPSTALVFCRRAVQHDTLAVMGPRTHATYHLNKDIPLSIKIRFRPGRARPFLGDLPVSEIADRIVPLSDLWGRPADCLIRRLAVLDADPPVILEHLEEALLAHLSAQTPSDKSRNTLLHSAIESLSVSPDPRPERVGATAKKLSVSERQLRKIFTDAVGMSPKHYTRLDRVRTVLAHAHDDDWARLAAQAGYYDQSHMTAEFRRTMGVSPGAFVAGRLPAAGPC